MNIQGSPRCYRHVVDLPSLDRYSPAKHKENLFVLSMTHVCQSWRFRPIRVKRLWHDIASNADTTTTGLQAGDFLLRQGRGRCYTPPHLCGPTIWGRLEPRNWGCWNVLFKKSTAGRNLLGATRPVPCGPLSRRGMDRGFRGPRTAVYIRDPVSALASIPFCQPSIFRLTVDPHFINYRNPLFCLDSIARLVVEGERFTTFLNTLVPA